MSVASRCAPVKYIIMPRGLNCFKLIQLLSVAMYVQLIIGLQAADLFRQADVSK